MADVILGRRRRFGTVRQSPVILAIVDADDRVHVVVELDLLLDGVDEELVVGAPAVGCSFAAPSVGGCGCPLAN